MAELQRATGSISILIFNFAVADFAMANELEFMATYIIWEIVVISVSWKEFQKIDGRCWQDTHSPHTSVQYSLFTSAERIARACLKNCMTSLCWKESVIWSHLLLFSLMPFSTSTSSSSFTLPSTTTPEHAAQSGHDLLQEHPAHQPLQALPVDKQRHQELPWCENLQSGGNPRTTTPTSYVPKELATVSRISRIIDPYQLYDAQRESGEQDHPAPITEEVMEFGENWDTQLAGF